MRRQLRSELAALKLRSEVESNPGVLAAHGLREKWTPEQRRIGEPADWYVTQECAVPFYMKFLFAEQRGLLDCTTQSSERLQRLLELQQELGGGAGFEERVLAHLDRELLKAVVITRGFSPYLATMKRERQAISELCKADLIVVPNLLDLSRAHLPEEWSVTQAHTAHLGSTRSKLTVCPALWLCVTVGTIV